MYWSVSCVVFALAFITLAPDNALASLHTPKVFFQTPYRTHSGTTHGIFASPHGVTEDGTSPFILQNQNDIQTFSASGKHLRTLNTTTLNLRDYMDNYVQPVMALDASNNTLFVAPLMNGSLVAIAVETLKVKWMFTPQGFSEWQLSPIQSLVFVEHSFAPSCPGGAGAVSIVMVNSLNDSTNFTITLIDMDSGSVCGPSVTVPEQYGLGMFGEFTDLMAFPKTTSRTQTNPVVPRAMFVAVQETNNTIFGLDAATGQVVWHFPINNTAIGVQSSFYMLVSGMSPLKNLVAYLTFASYPACYLTVRDVQTGSQVSQTPFTMTDNFQVGPGWGPSATHPEFGNIVISTNDVTKGNNTNALAFYNALDGTKRVVEVANLTSTPMVGLGEWTMAIFTTGNGTTEVVGIHTPAKSGEPTPPSSEVSFRLPDVARVVDPGNNKFKGLVPFTFAADGSHGVASFVWAGNMENEATGYFTVFRI